jgi:hypothetical protein
MQVTDEAELWALFCAILECKFGEPRCRVEVAGSPLLWAVIERAAVRPERDSRGPNSATAFATHSYVTPSPVVRLCSASAFSAARSSIKKMDPKELGLCGAGCGGDGRNKPGAAYSAVCRCLTIPRPTDRCPFSRLWYTWRAGKRRQGPNPFFHDVFM